jgi:Rab-GTPase-TBC domain
MVSASPRVRSKLDLSPATALRARVAERRGSAISSFSRPSSSSSFASSSSVGALHDTPRPRQQKHASSAKDAVARARKALFASSSSSEVFARAPATPRSKLASLDGARSPLRTRTPNVRARRSDRDQRKRASPSSSTSKRKAQQQRSVLSDRGSAHALVRPPLHLPQAASPRAQQATVPLQAKKRKRGRATPVHATPSPLCALSLPSSSALAGVACDLLLEEVVAESAPLAKALIEGAALRGNGDRHASEQRREPDTAALSAVVGVARQAEEQQVGERLRDATDEEQVHRDVVPQSEEGSAVESVAKHTAALAQRVAAKNTEAVASKQVSEAPEGAAPENATAPHARSKTHTLAARYNRYGFRVDENALRSKHSAHGDQPERTQAELCQEAVQRQRWIQVMQCWERNWAALAKPEQLDLLLGGVPDELRGVVWRLLCGVEQRRSARPALYKRMEARTELTDAVHQIRLDVGRTFIGHRRFEGKHSTGQQQLEAVLRAYSFHDPQIGYCQGMGFATGLLLMYMSPEDCFHVLTRVVGEQLRQHYHPSMAGLLADADLLQSALEVHLPALAAHLRRYGMHPLMYTTPWFLSWFTSLSSWESVLHFVSCFLLEGVTAVFRFGIALVEAMQSELLALTSVEQLLPFLQNPPVRLTTPAVLLPLVRALPVDLILTQARVPRHKRKRSSDRLSDGGARRSSSSALPDSDNSILSWLQSIAQSAGEVALPSVSDSTSTRACARTRSSSSSSRTTTTSMVASRKRTSTFSSSPSSSTSSFSSSTGSSGFSSRASGRPATARARRGSVAPKSPPPSPGLLENFWSTLSTPLRNRFRSVVDVQPPAQNRARCSPHAATRAGMDTPLPQTRRASVLPRHTHLLVPSSPVVRMHDSRRQSGTPAKRARRRSTLKSQITSSPLSLLLPCALELAPTADDNAVVPATTPSRRAQCDSFLSTVATPRADEDGVCLSLDESHCLDLGESENDNRGLAALRHFRTPRQPSGGDVRESCELFPLQ